MLENTFPFPTFSLCRLILITRRIARFARLNTEATTSRVKIIPSARDARDSAIPSRWRFPKKGFSGTDNRRAGAKEYPTVSGLRPERSRVRRDSRVS